MKNKMPETDSKDIGIALVGSLILFVLQLIVYFSSNITVILAGAFDTLSDILISVFLLISLFLSKKPADEFHMFGHGRAHVGALVTSTIFIFVLSFETFRQAVPKFFSPTTEFQNIGYAFIVTIIAIIIYAIPLLSILKAKEKRGAAIKAQLTALLEMEVAFIISLVSLILTSKGYVWADPTGSTIVGAVIALSGIYLFKDNSDFLLGKSPGKEFLEKVKSTAKSVKGVLDIHDLRAEYVGPDVVSASFHIKIAKGTSIEEANKITEEVDKKVSQKANCQYCTIHFDS